MGISGFGGWGDMSTRITHRAAKRKRRRASSF
jgi:hypothetical protein